MPQFTQYVLYKITFLHSIHNDKFSKIGSAPIGTKSLGYTWSERCQ